MKTLSLKLPDALDAKLAAVAKRSGTSKSEVVRSALESSLSERNKRRRPSCLALAEDLAGSVTGPADLSTNKAHFKSYGK